MDKLNLNEIKDIILIVSGIGTFISALVAMFTVLEIKKQRLSSYKPELILDSFVSFFYADNFLTKDDNIRYKTTKYLENNQKPLKETDKTISVHYLLQNIGFGTAKYVEGYWSFDYKKASKVLKKYINEDYLIENDNSGFSIRNEKNDFWLFFSKSNLDKDTIDFILPESQGDNGKGQTVPSIITKVYAYYIVFKYNISVGFNEKHCYEEFEELPKPKFKITYNDFNNKKTYKDFRISF
ncbi:hypothetical protein [Winogradskyella costae]|uniref:hypothetical protein n=1 Tax=Winogradskyella costae TaxID=2697008 RepID=UPI0015C8E9C3|nr:hypothetical protein [Winogradskyella costae]